MPSASSFMSELGGLRGSPFAATIESPGNLANVKPIAYAENRAFPAHRIC